MQTEKRYYEVEFDDGFDGYSICVLGVRMPTFEEARQFLEADIKRLRLGDVLRVEEISQEEAYAHYGMRESEDKLPVFGEK